MIDFLLESTVRVTIPLLLAWGLCFLLRSYSAATRHGVWSMALLSAAAMLFLPALFSTWALPVFPLPEARGLADAVRADRSAIPLIVAVAWLTGAGVLLLLFMGAVLRLRGWTRRAESLNPEHPVHEMARALTGQETLRLRVSHDTKVPFVWGLMRPTVVLPFEALAWSPADQRSALVHEFGHVSRHDAELRILGELLRALLWFHPLVWLCLARLRAESEAACDALVVSDGRRRTDYALQLLSLGDPKRAATGPAPSLSSSGRLERRIDRILSEDRKQYLPVSVRRSLFVIWWLGMIALASCAPVSPPDSTSFFRQEHDVRTTMQSHTEETMRQRTRTDVRTVVRAE